MTVKPAYGWGFDWDHRTKRRHHLLFGGFDLRNMNGPHFRRDWYDRAVWGCVLEWGDGNGDPVWSVGIELNVPAWWVQHCERRWDRKTRHV